MSSALNGKATLFITFNFPPQIGGIESLLYDIASGYPGRVVVLAPWAEGGEDFDRRQRFEIFRVKGPRSTAARIPLFLAAGFRLCRKNRFHHIQSANIFSGVVSMLLGGIFRIPYSVYVHGKEVYILNTALRSGLYRGLFARVLRNANKILSNSRFTSVQAERQGVEKSRVTQIPLGVDTRALGEPDAAEFAAFKERVERTAELKGRRVILTVARLVERKGHADVIRAMPQVLRAHPDAVYVIVGDGPERERLRTLTAELNLDHAVKFTGPLSKRDVTNFYRFARIFAMPSRAIEKTADVEGFGLVFLEANFCGLPVIAGNSGGIADAVLDGETGFLVEPGDVKSIAEKIVLLLSDEALRARLAQNGKKRVEEEFARSRTVEAVERGLSGDYL